MFSISRKSILFNIIIFAAAIFGLVPSVVRSQMYLYESTGRQYGLYGGYILGTQSASFSKLDTIPSCCPNYTGGSGTGFALGGLMNLRIHPKFDVSLRLGYSYLSSKMTNSSSTLIRIDDAPYAARFEYVMKSKVSDIGFEPLLTYYPFSWIGLSIGGRIGIVIQHDYEQYEELVDPPNRGVFVENGRRRRNEFAGTIPDQSYSYGSFLVGLSARAFQLGKYIEVRPELFYSFGMTDISTKVDWKNSYLRAGLSIVFDEKEARIDTVYQKQSKSVIDTVAVRSVRVMHDTIVVGKPQRTESNFYDAGVSTTIELTVRHDTLFTRPDPEAYIAVNPKVIYLKTQYITEAFPTLSMVFFDARSSEISSFYNRLSDRNEFSMESIRANAVEFHRNLLNVVGQRMSEDTKSKLVIRGYADAETEGASCELAQTRARSVAKYLESVWGIGSERLAVETATGNCQPIDPTNSVSALGAEDNRRVELSSADAELLAPVSRRHYSEITEIKPDSLEFNPIGSTIHGIRSWSLRAEQSGNAVFTIDKNAEPDLFQFRLSPAIAKHLSPESNLECYYEIKDVNGKTSRDRKIVQVVNDSSQAELERFSLILFAFSSDELPREAKENIRTYLAGIDADAEIRVTGYTDDLGSEEINESLSMGRARNTAEYIRKVLPGAKVVSAEGAASKKFAPGISSYSTAAERFLSRTVYIEILKEKK